VSIQVDPSIIILLLYTQQALQLQRIFFSIGRSSFAEMQLLQLCLF
jgi:hypothetical protein